MKLRVILLSTLLMCTSLSGWAQKAIDLGLSVKWADMNVGAEKPTDSGDLRACNILHNLQTEPN